MDGFEPGASVVVMGATNRAEILDTALLRPGRFDRTVEIPLPNQKERMAILAIHSRSKALGPDVDLDTVSRGTPGFSGADLANLVNEAAINAVRDGRDVLSAADFAAARDRLLIGRRDGSNALLPEEKRSVAVHESGHALVAMLSEHADPVAKVTILPRGAALGVTEQLPEAERHLYRQSYLTDALAVRLGGRAAEIVVLGRLRPGRAEPGQPVRRPSLRRGDAAVHRPGSRPAAPGGREPGDHAAAYQPGHAPAGGRSPARAGDHRRL
jgi:cell division protease FtsH